MHLRTWKRDPIYTVNQINTLMERWWRYAFDYPRTMPKNTDWWRVYLSKPANLAISPRQFSISSVGTRHLSFTWKWFYPWEVPRERFLGHGIITFLEDNGQQRWRLMHWKRIRGSITIIEVVEKVITRIAPHHWSILSSVFIRCLLRGARDTSREDRE